MLQLDDIDDERDLAWVLRSQAHIHHVYWHVLVRLKEKEKSVRVV